MRYIDVRWLHEMDDEPYRLVSEIGNDQYETRKLEFFKSDQIGYASSQVHTGNTMLDITEIPELEEINSKDEFQGKNISESEFEQLWREYVPHGS